ncbi:MAG TPA: glycosyltransferase [Pyrinomonadaceae bacterium]|nr:glycosyltransferase [Pyrinomonadaceae bacterium]
MRILKTTQTYYPYLSKGGPPAKVKGIARALSRRGHEVTVLTADLGETVEAFAGRDWRRERTKGDWGWEWQDEGVKAIYLKALAHYRATTISPRVLEFCLRRLADFELVHVYGLYDLLGSVVARFCRRRDLPYVIEPLGMFQPKMRSLQKKRLYHALIGDALFGGAGMVIATSETERQELILGGIADEKIALRRNGLDLDEFQSLPARGALRAKLGLGENERLVLFLGRLSFIKGLDVLVRAFGEIAGTHSDVRLVIAGPDDEDGCREEILRLVSKLKVEHRVSLPGPLYADQKLQALADADLFVLPSQYESFGNAAAEAIACGVPVLVTKGCGIAPLIDERVGLVVECTTEGLRAGLKRLLDDRALLADLRSRCAIVGPEFSWDEPVEEMERLYSSLIAAKNLPRPVAVAQSQTLL